MRRRRIAGGGVEGLQPGGAGAKGGGHGLIRLSGGNGAKARNATHLIRHVEEVRKDTGVVEKKKPRQRSPRCRMVQKRREREVQGWRPGEGMEGRKIVVLDQRSEKKAPFPRQVKEPLLARTVQSRGGGALSTAGGVVLGWPWVLTVSRPRSQVKPDSLLLVPAASRAHCSGISLVRLVAAQSLNPEPNAAPFATSGPPHTRNNS